jgi:sulfur relay protein TusB/DsrH
MSKLVLLKGMDEEALSMALGLEDAAVVLLQDAVYHARESPLIAEAAKRRAIYILGVDAVRRGLDAEPLKGLLSIGYGEFVDLVFSGAEVINL